MGNIITIDYVKKQFLNDGYEVLTDIYCNAKTKFEAKCDKGHTFITSWDNFKQGSRCKKCRNIEANRRISKTTEQFNKEVMDWGKGDYKLLSKYEHNARKVKLLHVACGNVFEMAPNSFKQGQRCPICATKRVTDAQRKTQEQFESEVYEIVGNEFTVLSEYKNNKSQILFKHNTCGYEFRRIAINFLTESHSCPNCGKVISNRTTESLKEEIHDLTNGEYSLLSEYKRMKVKVKIRHNKCKHEWKIAPDTFINQGIRCPRCSESKAENIIYKYLTDNKIEFKPQYRISGCRNIRPLPFDFAIFSETELIALIEYDGEQHYKPWYKIGKEKAELQLAKTQFNDNIKNEYCKKHNINLIRIPYWHKYKIENILNEFFKV